MQKSGPALKFTIPQSMPAGGTKLKLQLEYIRVNVWAKIGSLEQASQRGQNHDQLDFYKKESQEKINIVIEKNQMKTGRNLFVRVLVRK